ncbi:MAG: hypothetical protein CME70_11155 [Halobacteriovorax sp.]|nr:hypothetical protein [Halobacteriovorax sp.]
MKGWVSTKSLAKFGGRSELLDELCNAEPYVPIIITHFFNKPIQNSGLLRKLYLEKDLSSYEIHRKTNWSRTSISDALRTLGIEKSNRKAPVLSYGEKLIGTTRVVHKGEQKIIEKMLALLDEEQNFSQISKYLNSKNIPTKRGGSWHPSTVKEIIKRIQKRKA